MSRATRLVVYYVLLFFILAPGAFLGWHWSIGVVCGLGIAITWAWRNDWPDER